MGRPSGGRLAAIAQVPIAPCAATAYEGSPRARTDASRMSHNTFGHLFRVTTWGESHGPAIGCVVDGCPPLLTLSEAYIQGFLDKRRPGTSRFTTQRREPDRVKILSGVLPRALAQGAPGLRGAAARA